MAAWKSRGLALWRMRWWFKISKWPTSSKIVLEWVSSNAISKVDIVMYVIISKTEKKKHVPYGPLVGTTEWYNIIKKVTHKPWLIYTLEFLPSFCLYKTYFPKFRSQDNCPKHEVAAVEIQMMMIMMMMMMMMCHLQPCQLSYNLTLYSRRVSNWIILKHIHSCSCYTYHLISHYNSSHRTCRL